MELRDALAYFIGRSIERFKDLRVEMQNGNNGPFLQELENFLEKFGWENDNLYDVSKIDIIFKDLKGLDNDLVEILSEYDSEQFWDLIEQIDEILSKFEEFQNTSKSLFDPKWNPEDWSEFVSTFPVQILDYLVIKHLEEEYPHWYYFFKLIGVIIIEDRDPEGDHRISYNAKEIDWSSIIAFFSDPNQWFSDRYAWATEEFDKEKAETLGKLLQSLVEEFNKGELPEFNFGETEIEEPENWFHAKMGNTEKEPNIYWITIHEDQASGNGTGDVKVRLGLYFLEGDGSKEPGIAILLHTEGDMEINKEIPLGNDWLFRAYANVEHESGIAALIRPGDEENFKLVHGILEENSNVSEIEGEIYISLRHDGSGGTKLKVFGIEDGAGIELKGFGFKVGAEKEEGEEGDIYAKLNVNEVISIILPDGDNFIKQVITSDIEHKRSFDAGLSYQNGLHFNSNPTLEVELASFKEVLGILIKRVKFRLKQINPLVAINEQDLQFDIGPVEITIVNIGLKGEIDLITGDNGLIEWSAFEEGDIGPFKVSIDFQSPTGIAISIDLENVSGGGFLNRDPEEEKYTGAVKLSMSDYTFSALAILETRLPGNEDGYSLLLIVYGTFPPIELGMGFTLNGLGGLAGLHRTMKPDRLREDLSNGTADNILFPDDPVENAQEIISDLESVFPPAEGQFVVGPMALIAWKGELIRGEIGILIEFPEPVRVAILGIVEVTLPEPDADKVILYLKVTFLGTINFNESKLAFDATLSGSRLLSMTLAGDIALRLGWNDPVAFVLSVGGFHPDYEAPPMEVPDLDRISLTVFDKDNLQGSIEFYYAVTSNTVQFGASLDLYISAGRFSAEGNFWFDALIEFSSVYFIVSIGANVAIYRRSRELTSLYLDLTLEGYTPWRVNGTAKISILGTDASVRFDRTFGREDNNLIDAAHLWELLKEALKQENHWTARYPSDSNILTVMRNDLQQWSGSIVHPNGSLAMKQALLPLVLKLEMFGDKAIDDFIRFKIDAVLDEDNETMNFIYINEQFAPGHFIEMTNDEKLKSPSFEKMKGGIRITGEEKPLFEYYTEKNTEIKVSKIDSLPQFFTMSDLGLEPISSELIEVDSQGGSASNSPFSPTEEELAPSGFNFDDEKWTLQDGNIGEPIQSGGQTVTYNSWSEAHEAWEEQHENDPEIDIIPISNSSEN